MKLKYREIERALDYLLERGLLLRNETESLCIRANTDMDDGISGISYDGSRSSGPADPVGSRAEKNRKDHVAAAAQTFRSSVADAVRAIQRAEKAGWSLRALDKDEARALTEQDEVNDTGRIQGDCKNPNCGRPVARTAKDPMRGGRCNACRTYLDRNGIERPKALCDINANAAEALALDESVIVQDVA